jgi:serine incorporator 1/3
MRFECSVRFLSGLVILLKFGVLTVIFFFAESISKFGSGLFLLVQVILLLDFVHGWNENWVAKDEQFWLVVCHCPLFYLRFH